jgi:radical SAM superfamily enzyme YgiQ (UPF0313 family)
MTLYDRLQPLLPYVSQPQRYAGVEAGAYRKEAPRLKAALVFPDLYEIGMAHTGFQLLYHVGNSIPGVFLQRAFAPWTDLGDLMRQSGVPLFTVETFEAVGDMPLVAFTLPTDLHATTFLYCLDLAGIPLLRSGRGDSHPIVMAGGLAAANPAPLMDFVDVFAVGDGELLLPQALNLFLEHPEWGREKKLEALAGMKGFLVPEWSRGPARRVYLKDLDEGAFDFQPLLPAYPSVHHRFNVELMRGCAWGCRYCQAGYWYRPLRERSVAAVKTMLLGRAGRSGFTEVGLLSLSTADYGPVVSLASALLEGLAEQGVSLSLPSLRINSVTLPLLSRLQRVRKSGLTFAPECGASLRPHINKAITDDEILEAVAQAKSMGWRAVKLYFILGLPFETEAHLDEIGELVRKIRSTGIRGVTVHVANFIPKPWTPFQWAVVPTVEEIREKQAHLRRILPRRDAELKLADPVMSRVEAAFSRGDESLGRVLLEAYRQGCVFDNWDEIFKGDVWMRLLPPDIPPSPDGILPWERWVDSGITRDFLEREWERAQRGEFSSSCRTACLACGLGRAGEDLRISKAFQVPSSKFQVETPKPNPPEGHEEVLLKPGSGPQPAACHLPPKARVRYLLHFTKTGPARWLSYRNYANFIVEGLLREGVPLAFTGGFNPHPVLHLGPALPVGIESRDEVLEIACRRTVDWPAVTFDASGISLRRADALPEAATPLSKRITGFRFLLSGAPVEFPPDILLKTYDPLQLEKTETRLLDAWP